MKKILILDNYDSFTYNLFQIVDKIKPGRCEVFRNDKIQLSEVNNYHQIILSPGPGIPSEAGIMPELVKEYASKKSILGVCLGHQCIGEVFGAKLKNLDFPVHGKSSEITVTDGWDYLFKGLPQKITVGRYHSWIVEEENLPEELQVSAIDMQGRIMALSHKKYDLKGVQFHPESIMTECGEQIIRNWLDH